MMEVEDVRCEGKAGAAASGREGGGSCRQKAVFISELHKLISRACIYAFLAINIL